MKNNEITKRPDMSIFDKQFPIRLTDAPIDDPTKFTILTGDDGILDDLFSYQVYNKIKNHWRAAAAPADKQPGMIRSDTDDDKLHHYGDVGGEAWEEVLQLTRSNDVSPQFATVRFMDTGADHYLDVKCNENLTAHRLLNFVVGDAARTITLGGNLTLGGTLTTGGILTTAANFVTQNNNVTINAVGAARTITLSGSPSLGDWFDQAVKQASNPTFGNLTLAEYLYRVGDADTYLRFQDDHITLRAGGIDFINMVEAGTDYLQLLAGLNFIGDNANAKMTVGLTINQAGNDDEILAFKSSDVDHGMTDLAETDTYGAFLKVAGDAGGLRIEGYSELVEALYFQADATNDNTTKSAAGTAPIMFAASKRAGATHGNVGADANLVAIRNHGTTVWIVDEDGDIWQSGAVVAEKGASVASANMVTALGVAEFLRSTSSKKYKDKIKDLELDSSGIYQFRPRSFNSLCKADDKNKRFIGLIADEIEPICPEMINYNEKNEAESYDNQMLMILILAETQRHEARIAALESQLNN